MSDFKLVSCVVSRYNSVRNVNHVRSGKKLKGKQFDPKHRQNKCNDSKGSGQGFSKSKPSAESIYSTTMQIWNCSPKTMKIVLVVISLLVFSPSLFGDFVFDDSEAIVGNPDVVQQTSLVNIFYSDYWGAEIRSNSSHKSYRPLTILTFRLNYWISGLNPLPFHLINILLHAVIAVLLHDVYTSLVIKYATCGSTANWVANVGAILFAIHPIHSEPVCNVVGRAELLSAVIYLCTLSYYLKLTESGQKSSLLPIFFGSLLAMLAKEQGLMILLVCCALEILDSPLLEAVFPKNDSDGDKSTKSYSRIAFLAASLIILAFLRISLMGFTTPNFTSADNPSAFLENSFYKIINFNFLYVYNLWLLLWPSTLCFDWSMGCFDLIISITDGRLLLVIGFWFCLFLVIYTILIRHFLNKKLLIISAVLLVIPFLPASNLFFPVGFVIAERVLYLPSIGFCLLVALCINQIQNSYLVTRPSDFTRNLTVTLITVIMLLTAKSVQRSREWATEENLYMSGLTVCPNNAKIHYNIGKILTDKGLDNQAELSYLRALKLYPNYENAMNNLANVLKDMGRVQEAADLLNNAVKLRPGFGTAWMNLGISLSALHRYEDAEKAYRNSIKVRTHCPDCYYNLGNMYLEQGRKHDAFTAWQNATKLNPKHSKALVNMVILADELDEFQLCQFIAQESLHQVQNCASLFFSLGNCYGRATKFEDAEEFFKNAIALQPSHPEFYLNLGVLYQRWNKLKLAKENYVKALSLDNSLINAKKYLNQIDRKMSK